MRKSIVHTVVQWLYYKKAWKIKLKFHLAVGQRIYKSFADFSLKKTTEREMAKFNSIIIGIALTLSYVDAFSDSCRHQQNTKIGIMVCSVMLC